MRKYIAQKLIHSMIVLLIVAMVTFILGEIAPGDYVTSISSPGTPPSESLAMRTAYHLNRPLEIRFVDWFGELIRGNWCNSYVLPGNPAKAVLKALRFTCALIVSSVTFSYLIAVLIVPINVKFRNRWPDKLLSFISYCGMSIPEIWISMVIIVLCYTSIEGLAFIGLAKNIAHFEWLDYIKLLFFPTIILTFKITAMFTRYLRTFMIGIYEQEFIWVARSRGVSEFNLYKDHVIRNISIPLLTMGVSILPDMLGSAAILELLFRIPGIGSLFIGSAFTRDIPLLLSIVLLMATVTLMASFILDLCYWLIDPRIRYE